MKDWLTILQLGIAIWQIKRLAETEMKAQGIAVPAVMEHPLEILQKTNAGKAVMDPMMTFVNAVEVSL